MPETDTVFHLGSELHNAVNRMDFFRLFKSLASLHGNENFILVELSGDNQFLDLDHEHTLHNASKAFLGKESFCVGRDDPLVEYLLTSTAPGSFDGATIKTPLIERCEAKSAIVVPLHTPLGKRFGLILLRRGQGPQHQELALIALEASIVFQRYFEAVLSLDSITGLTDREIEILIWTSEGKTSSDIAIILGLSEHTVNSYIAGMLRKMEVVNRAQMVALALRNGLIT